MRRERGEGEGKNKIIKRVFVKVNFDRNNRGKLGIKFFFFFNIRDS